MHKLLKILLGIACLSLFSAISCLILTQQTLSFDTAICEAIYKWRSASLTAIFTVITYLANWQTVTILCFLALIPRLTRRSFGIPMAVAAILSSILYKGIKTFFARPRPDVSLHLIEQGGYSFPSGHSMTGLVFYGMILWLCYLASKKSLQPIWTGSLSPIKVNPLEFLRGKFFLTALTIVIFLLIFLIGFSRIYLGVHYPSDVLAGWCLGGTVLLILTSIFSPNYFKER